MRSLIAFLVGSVIAGGAAAQVGLAQQATGDFFKACQAKLRGSQADVRAEQDAIQDCTVEAAVTAGVLPRAIVESCRAELATTPNSRGRMVRICAQFQHLGSRMDDREWRTAIEDVCNTRANLQGHRYQGRKGQCLVDSLLQTRQISAAKRQACTRPPSGNPVHDADELWRCLSAPGNS